MPVAARFRGRPGRALRQRTQQAETPLEMGDRFEVRQSRRGMPPGLQPLIDRAFRVASGRQMMGEQLRLALDEIGEMLLPVPPRRARAIPAAVRAAGSSRQRPAPARA